MTTLFKQYHTIKEKYKDAILLFRTGEAYEAFDDDAKILSTVTGVELHSSENAAIKHTASLPFHTLDRTLAKLVKIGYKVGVCEELQDPKAKRSDNGA